MYHAVRKASRPAPTMLPQLTTLGSPTPRNARPASDRMAWATSTAVVTMMVGRALGRISRKMMRAWPAPSVCAARTNSRSRREMNSPRVSRAMPVHGVTPSAKIMVDSDGPRMATSTMASRKDGTGWNSSVMRISTAAVRWPA
ncbi:hypothetical protein G6F63_015483 [Rhizopus arrhizus]|nr:hypothetical protein G6F63_015483 [Rhizopus arrhizus]